MNNIKKYFKSPSLAFDSVVIGLLFAAGISFAAWSTTTWHDTNTWVQTGEIITAQEVAENFEYLKDTKVETPPICAGDGKALQWSETGWGCADVGGGGDAPLLEDNGHVDADCIAAGGTLYNTGYGYSLCEMDSCGSGWLQKDNWSATSGRTCGSHGGCFGGTGNTTCYTGEHGLANQGVDSCSYQNTYDSNGNNCRGGSATCYSVIIKYGCY